MCACTRWECHGVSELMGPQTNLDMLNNYATTKSKIYNQCLKHRGGVFPTEHTIAKFSVPRCIQRVLSEIVQCCTQSTQRQWYFCLCFVQSREHTFCTTEIHRCYSGPGKGFHEVEIPCTATSPPARRWSLWIEQQNLICTAQALWFHAIA